MQMRPCAASRITHIADDIAFPDACSRLYRHSRQMQINRAEAVAVINFDMVPVIGCITAGHDQAIRRRNNFPAKPCRNIQAFMKFNARSEGRPSDANSDVTQPLTGHREGVEAKMDFCSLKKDNNSLKLFSLSVASSLSFSIFLRIPTMILSWF